MSEDLKKLYDVIQKNTIFNEKEICENCPIICSREQKWHWLLPNEVERLKNKMWIENKFGSFFFEGGKCPLLKNTNCDIYENRPLECKLSPLSLYYKNGKLSWIIDISCPYFKKYGKNKMFWKKVNKFINTIEDCFTENTIKNIIEISKAIDQFDPLIENKDFIIIKKFKSTLE